MKGNAQPRRRRVVAVAAKYARADGSLEIGGVETYLTQLARVFRDTCEFVVYQPAREPFGHDFADLRVVGHPAGSCQALTDHVVSEVLGEHDVLLFSTEQLNATSHWRRSVVIQHGIYWDLPVQCYAPSSLARWRASEYKIFDNWRNLRRIRGHRNIVCVDYAYSTWLRSVTNLGLKDAQLWIIPNNAGEEFFALPAPQDEDTVSVLFARRFMQFRGTRLFARVAAKLLDSHRHVRVTLCGEGPDAEAMREILKPSERAVYCEVSHAEMPAMIARHHIVVVPSLGSEGTSLSAIEGLAAGRAVVASAVGGVPNIILDGFNGLLVQPGAEAQLHRALETLVESAELRARLGNNARAASRAQLGFDAWAGRWRGVLEAVVGA